MACPTSTFRATTPPPGRTFANQHTLPKLPIPSLDVTCKRYLTALRGLQDDNEHAASQRAVQAFLDVEGPALQERLNEWAKDKARCVSPCSDSLVPMHYFIDFLHLSQLYRGLLVRFSVLSPLRVLIIVV
jgi:hypothetical protein